MHLEAGLCNPDVDEEVRVDDPVEDIHLIIDLACVDLVEQLHRPHHLSTSAMQENFKDHCTLQLTDLAIPFTKQRLQTPVR